MLNRIDYYLMAVLLLTVLGLTASAQEQHYLEKILPKVENNWNDYFVIYEQPTGGTFVFDDIEYKAVYDLTYRWNDILEKGLTQVSIVADDDGNRLHRFSDILLYENIKADEINEPNPTIQRYLRFREPILNRGAVLMLLPLRTAQLRPIMPKSLDYDSLRNDFSFLGKNAPGRFESVKLEDTMLRLTAAYDLDADSKADIAIFMSTKHDYTRTFIVGRVENRWVILSVDFPC